MSRRGWCYSAVCGRKRQRGERLFIVRRFGEDVGTSFGAFGFTYVTLDLLGYRTGSMNETLQ